MHMRSARTAAGTRRPLVRNGLPWLAAVALLLTGCAGTPASQPESMRDPQADFSAYSTYGWKSGPVDADDPPLRLLDSNLRAAIATEMRRRGYTEAPEGATPDLRIVYDTTTADRVGSSPVRVGVGMGSWGGNVGGSVNVGTPSVRNYREGTLVIHAIDTRRNAEVWQGRVSRRITKGSLEPADIGQAVAAAMRDFPAR
jgi:hypothetical protein